MGVAPTGGGGPATDHCNSALGPKTMASDDEGEKTRTERKPGLKELFSMGGGAESEDEQPDVTGNGEEPSGESLADDADGSVTGDEQAPTVDEETDPESADGDMAGSMSMELDDAEILDDSDDVSRGSGDTSDLAETPEDKADPTETPEGPADPTETPAGRPRTRPPGPNLPSVPRPGRPQRRPPTMPRSFPRIRRPNLKVTERATDAMRRSHHPPRTPSRPASGCSTGSWRVVSLPGGCSASSLRRKPKAS